MSIENPQLIHSSASVGDKCVLKGSVLVQDYAQVEGSGQLDATRPNQAIQIQDHAKVTNSYLYGGTKVYGNAIVEKSTLEPILYSSIEICENAVVRNAFLRGSILVRGSAILLGGRWVGDFTITEGVWAGPDKRLSVTITRNDILRLHPSAVVENVTVSGTCFIGNAVVKESTLIGNVVIHDHAWVEGSHLENLARLPSTRWKSAQILIGKHVTLRNSQVFGASCTIRGTPRCKDPYVEACVIHGTDTKHLHLEGADWSGVYFTQGTYTERNLWRPIIDTFNAPIQTGEGIVYIFPGGYMTISRNKIIPVLLRKIRWEKQPEFRISSVDSPVEHGFEVCLPRFWMPAEHRKPVQTKERYIETTKDRKSTVTVTERPPMQMCPKKPITGAVLVHVGCACGWEISAYPDRLT